MVYKRPRGLWKPGTWVEKKDVELSMPAFRMELGKWEAAVTTFGMWFGTPISAIGMVPFVINALAMPSHLPRWAVAAAAYSVFGVWWADILRESKRIMRGIPQGGLMPAELKYHGFARAVLPLSQRYGSRIGIASLVIWIVSTVAIITGMGGAGARMARLYISSWLTTEVFVLIMKDLFQRPRPAVALKEELSEVRREFRQLQTGLNRNSTAHASFPSGDAAGAAVFAASAFLLSGNALWLLIAPLASFGRMYFHAHHLLDVSVGVLIGFVVTVVLNGMFKHGLTTANFLMLTGIDVAMILGVFASRTLYIKNDQVF